MTASPGDISVQGSLTVVRKKSMHASVDLLPDIVSYRATLLVLQLPQMLQICPLLSME